MSDISILNSCEQISNARSAAVVSDPSMAQTLIIGTTVSVNPRQRLSHRFTSDYVIQAKAEADNNGKLGSEVK